jgi:methionine biosynthesis protein MetW
MNKDTSVKSREEQKKARFDYRFIVRTIEEKSKVLDLGCGTGELLQLLKDKKSINAVGIEIKQDRVQKCVQRGLSVLHGDLDEGLRYYKDKSFDYVIFNETIQVVKNSLLVLKEALRVGKKVIVSFPNFGHWQIRFSYFLSGRMPKSKSLPYEWYNTPNIRLLTIKDFRELCKKNKIRIIKESSYINRNAHSSPVKAWSNLLASNSIFVIEER